MTMDWMMVLVPCINVAISLLFFLGIPLCLGIVVYRDAKARGMDAVLWALVAALIPCLIGLIIYLIIRNQAVAMFCGKCGRIVQEQFISCPYCGLPLKQYCEGCGCPVESDWNVCAQCGVALPPGRPSWFYMQKPPENKKIWILLLCLLLIPLILLIGSIMIFHWLPVAGSQVERISLLYFS